MAAPPEHLDWIARRSGYRIGPDYRAIEAVDGTGRIRGMVGFDHWLGGCAEMHVALDSVAAARALLRPAFSYLFDEAGQSAALGFVVSGNTKSLRLAEHLGFREVHRVRGGGGLSGDVVILELRRDECRWIRGEA